MRVQLPTQTIYKIGTINSNGVEFTEEAIKLAIAKWNEREEYRGRPTFGSLENTTYEYIINPELEPLTSILTPDGKLSMQKMLHVDLDKVSHEITNVHLDGDEVKCNITLLNTPMGNMVKDLIEAFKNSDKLPVRFSPRIIGKIQESLNEDGSLRREVKDCDFITISCINNPIEKPCVTDFNAFLNALKS